MKTTLFFLLLFTASAFASEKQQVDIKIRSVTTQECQTPIYSDDDDEDTLQISGIQLKQSQDKKWLRIFTHYETRPEWIDHLTIEFYLLLPGSTETPLLFRGEVRYENIPKGRNHLAEMYLHFNTYKRHYRRGVIRSAISIKIDGTLVASDKKRAPETQWWKNTPSNPCALLNRMDTPFRVINIEKYEAQTLCP